MVDNPLFNKFVRGTTPFLIRISHVDLETPLYITDNNEELTYEGQVYSPYFFKFTMPDNNGDSQGNAKMTISVVDQQLIRIIRSLSTPPTLTFIAVYQESKSVFVPLERGAMTFGSTTWNAQTLDADLVLDTVLLLECPSGKFTPVTAQGIT